MRQYEKKAIKDTLKLLQRLHILVGQAVSAKNYKAAGDALTQGQQGAIELGTKIEERAGEGTRTVHLLEAYCEQVWQFSRKIPGISGNTIRSGLDAVIDNVRESLDELDWEPFRVLFLPYKASMWTAFDSIYRSAAKDECCEAAVVAIPYYEIGNKLKEPVFCYEKEKFPSDIPITDWQEYSLEKEHPDMIFIHNPYDDGNNLTSVHPFYYSDNLKKHTACLIYSPYFTIGGYTRGKSDFHYINKGTVNADKVIVQSEFVEKIYESYGYHADKFLSCGSPKADYVIQNMNSRLQLPKEWEEKLSGKKVFLLNTHLSYFPSGYSYKDYWGYNFAEVYHNQLLRAIRERKDCGLIWRPHPLLFTMVHTRFPECEEYVNHLREELEHSDNCVIDTSGDYRNAFGCSDALISTYSSLNHEYLITGKPVMIFQTPPTDAGGERSPIDFRTCYFRFGREDKMTFGAFMDMVCRGEDPKREERIGMLGSKAFANLNGTAGVEIWNSLKQWMAE